MSKFVSAVQAFIADENGVTAMEYGLIAALISVGIVAAVTDIGESIKTAFESIATALE